jgi:hypothetical protein
MNRRFWFLQRSVGEEFLAGTEKASRAAADRPAIGREEESQC